MTIKSAFSGAGVRYLLSALCLVFFLWAATGSDDSSSSSSPSSEPQYVEPEPPVFSNGVDVDESTNEDDDTIFSNDVDEDED